MAFAVIFVSETVRAAGAMMAAAEEGKGRIGKAQRGQPRPARNMPADPVADHESASWSQIGNKAQRV